MAGIRLRCRENGPIVIDLPAGTVFRLDGQATTLDRDKLALCRCGESATKPLCDGTHKRAGFVSPVAYIDVESGTKRDAQQ